MRRDGRRGKKRTTNNIGASNRRGRGKSGNGGGVRDGKGRNARKFNCEGEATVYGRKGKMIAVLEGGTRVKLVNEPLNVFSGDVVYLKYTSRRGGMFGKIERILKRNVAGFVCSVSENGGRLFGEAVDYRENFSIVIDLNNSVKVSPGDEVFAVLDSDISYEEIRGRVVENFSGLSEREKSVRVSTLRFGIDYSFPADVEKRAMDIGANFDIRGVEDLRNSYCDLPLFTIDPEDAKDFDDAISVRGMGGGIREVGVHIADVSYFVKPGDALDVEAYRRGNSTYLAERTIPMLPEALSNDLCSLNPGEKKLAFSVFFKVGENFEVANVRFERTIILSRKRFSYEEAQRVLDFGGEFYEELSYLNAFAKNILSDRRKSGAYFLETEEIKVALNPDGSVRDIYKKKRLDTHKLIEALMLLANESVAKFMAEKRKSGGVAVSRVHALPGREKVKELEEFLVNRGFSPKTDENGIISADEIAGILAQIDDPIEREIISVKVVRSMQKAFYSAGESGHFGLGMKYYTHFTSPIRRYADLIVHRIMGAYLDGGSPGDVAKSFKGLEGKMGHLLDREIFSMEAERDSVKRKQLEFIRDNNIKRISGYIVGVEPFGMFVKDLKTFAVGLVSVFDNDAYFYNEELRAIEDISSGRRYVAGDRIGCEVAGVDIDRGRLDLVVAGG